jgi:toxin CcdB
MGRFDVYRNASPGSRFPLLLDVQADLLADLATRIVIPLISDRETDTPIRGLQPAVAIDGERYVLRTELTGSVHRSQLGSLVTSLKGQRDVVVSALDFLFDGF